MPGFSQNTQLDRALLLGSAIGPDREQDQFFGPIHTDTCGRGLISAHFNPVRTIFSLCACRSSRIATPIGFLHLLAERGMSEVL